MKERRNEEYYSPVKINEGKYYEIDLPLKLVKIEKLDKDDIAYEIYGPCKAKNTHRYQLYLESPYELFRPYVTLSDSDYNILESFVNGCPIRVTTYQLIDDDRMFVGAISITIFDNINSITKVFKTY